MENSKEVPQKIKNRTTIGSSNSPSGYIAKRNEITISKRYLHPHIYCSIIHNSQDMETISVSVDGGMDKETWCTYTMEYYSAIKKKEILPFATT